MNIINTFQPIWILEIVNEFARIKTYFLDLATKKIDMMRKECDYDADVIKIGIS